MPKMTQQPGTRSWTTSSARKCSNLLTHAPTPAFSDSITHTGLASADPDATKTWCAKVLG